MTQACQPALTTPVGGASRRAPGMEATYVSRQHGGLMSNSSNIAQTRVEDLIEAISGRRASPGAGAAGAVTLALAAACTAKAVAISLGHQPEHAVLRRSQVTVESIARFA